MADHCSFFKPFLDYFPIYVLVHDGKYCNWEYSIQEGEISLRVSNLEEFQLTKFVGAFFSPHILTRRGDGKWDQSHADQSSPQIETEQFNWMI